jgi:hypothetical protein
MSNQGGQYQQHQDRQSETFSDAWEQGQYGQEGLVVSSGLGQ